jgi:hypothetical protein
VVDALFRAADADTVTVKDIVSAVARHFRLPAVERGTKRRIKARLTDLVQGRDAPVPEEALELERTGSGGVSSPHSGGAGAATIADPGTETARKACLELPDSAADVSFGEAASFQNDVAAQEDLDGAEEVSSNCAFSDKATHVTCQPLESKTPCEGEQTRPFAAAEAAPYHRHLLQNVAGAPGQVVSRQRSPPKGVAANPPPKPQTRQHGAAQESTVPHAGNHCSTPKSLNSMVGRESDGDSWMTATLFQNLSPDVSISTTPPYKSSFGESLKSRNVVEKDKWSLGSEIGAGSFGRVYMGMNHINGSE